MTNPKKTIKPVPSKPTEEEKAAALHRAFSQQFQSIAQGALYNILQNIVYRDYDPQEVVGYAFTIAREYMLQQVEAIDETFADYGKALAERNAEK